MRQAPLRLVVGWRFRSARPDAASLAWIRDPGSLTRRLQQRSAGRFRVRVIRLGFARPRRDECEELRIPAGEWALIREVVLEGRGEPWVVARSVIPLATLKGANRRLRFLGDRPLGAFLFRDPTLRRDAVRVVRHDGAWGRRSRFCLRGRPLLVAECFLPALLSAGDTPGPTG